MKKRRSFSAEFKARVALEALSGAHTLAELSAKHNVHPNMIAQWKRRAQENLPELFSKKKDRSEGALALRQQGSSHEAPGNRRKRR